MRQTWQSLTHHAMQCIRPLREPQLELKNRHDNQHAVRRLTDLLADLSLSNFDLA